MNINEIPEDKRGWIEITDNKGNTYSGVLHNEYHTGMSKKEGEKWVHVSGYKRTDIKDIISFRVL